MIKPMALLRRLVLACAPLALACVPIGFSPAGRKGVVFASTPQGAQLLIDGRDSGFVTPCALRMEDTGPHRVDFLLPGYQVATRILAKNSSYWFVPWKDGDLGVETWRFPLWLDVPSLLAPIEYRAGLQPARMHVQLRPLADG